MTFWFSQMSTYTGKVASSLSLSDKKELEIPCELYTTIKLLDLVEKVYIFEKISEDDYYQKTDKATNKIKMLEKQLKMKNPNFTVNGFIDEYGLKDCSWAIQKLAGGTSKVEKSSAGGSYLLIAQLTGKFVEMNDNLAVNEDEPYVKTFLPLIEEMVQLLLNFKKVVAKDMNLHERYQALLEKISHKGLSEKLTPEEYKELVDINEYANRQFQLYLQKMR